MTSPKSATENTATPAADPQDDAKILIIASEDSSTRGGLLATLGLRRASVSASTLREQINTFLESMSRVLDEVKPTIGGFQLQSLTLSVEVNAKGSVSLLGTGGEVGGKGGLTFTLTKVPPPPSPASAVTASSGEAATAAASPSIITTP